MRWVSTIQLTAVVTSVNFGTLPRWAQVSIKPGKIKSQSERILHESEISSLGRSLLSSFGRHFHQIVSVNLLANKKEYADAFAG